jgi:hypothetical protein
LPAPPEFFDAELGNQQQAAGRGALRLFSGAGFAKLGPMRRFCLASFCASLLILPALAACGGTTPPAGTGGAPLGSGGAPGGSGGVGLASGGTVGSGGGSGSGGAGSGGTASGGGMATGGSSSGGATSGTGGGLGSGGTGTGTGLGYGMFEGEGRSEEQYFTALVSRNEVPYVFITNGWGPGFDAHVNSWLGTSFVVETMTGSAGSMGQPASYPTVFCGRYSVAETGDCGLPAARASLTSLRTGWRWKSNGNDAGQYNAAYDIWLGTETMFQTYFMVWLRDPTNFQPAGDPTEHNGITVANVPGVWNIVAGTVNSRPIVNYVRAEGMDSTELEFDVLDFIADAETRGYSIPTHVRAVAVGFEIWEGPIAGLTSEDFYVEVE